MEYDIYDQVIYNEIKEQMDGNATYHFGHKKISWCCLTGLWAALTVYVSIYSSMMI